MSEIEKLKKELLQKESEKIEVHGILIRLQKQVWSLQDELKELKKKDRKADDDRTKNYIH